MRTNAGVAVSVLCASNFGCGLEVDLLLITLFKFISHKGVNFAAIIMAITATLL